MLSYLAENESATPYDIDNIGCAFPHLKLGNVKLQVMAIYAPTENGSTKFGLHQAELFKQLVNDYSSEITHVKSLIDLTEVIDSNKTGIVGAIENASAFCEEDEHLDDGFDKLEKILKLCEKTMYITFTHMKENRFGGGNYSNVGLKDDGRELLKYLSGKKIAVDFSHTSDYLAHDIFNFIDAEGLDIPVLASHSNFRSVHAHKSNRNLLDEIAKEILDRNGIICVNFIKDFIGHSSHLDLHKHIFYGFENGYENNIGFGADFFWAPPEYKSDRGEFFYEEHCNASKYQALLDRLSPSLSTDQLNKISSLNVLKYLENNW